MTELSPKTTCDFCGKHKNVVPLLVTSNVTGATICGFCSTLVIQQVMQHQMRTGTEFKKIVDAFPDMFEQDEHGAVRVVPGDKRLDAAIKAVEDAKSNEEDKEEGDEETLCEPGTTEEGGQSS